DGFISLYQSSYQIAEFCKQQKNLNEFIDIYMQSVLLQSICINQLNTFWYQLDLEKSFVLGLGKDQISLRQHYHNLMVDCLKTINKPIYDNLNQDKEPLNKFYFDSAKTMLFSDMWLYSIPLIVAPLDKPRLPTTDIEYGVPILTIPTDAPGPFIYRIDGLNMLPKLGVDQYRPIPKLDPLTSCYGTFLNVENNIKIKLTTKRNIMVRIFGVYPKGVQHLKVGSSKLESVQQSVPCLPVMFKKPKSYESGLNQDEILEKQNQYLESNGATSGFSCVSKMLKNVQLCSIDISQENNSWSCIKFIEVIITDPSQQDIQEREANEKILNEKRKKAEEIYEKIIIEEEPVSDQEQKIVQEYESLMKNESSF
ncbi:hypothetical protein CYY_008873, partial [Polysphondylium violaceum]